MTGSGPLYITAINNLPAMLPGESSLDFERQLLTYLSDFKEDSHGVWKRAKEVFDTTVKRVLI
jgi:saccharopine dehydrogenase (NAD+, L-lysine-forming)